LNTQQLLQKERNERETKVGVQRSTVTSHLLQGVGGKDGFQGGSNVSDHVIYLIYIIRLDR